MNTSADAAYFGRVRSEIAPLLPAQARVICDIGCGMGATLRWLAGRYPGATRIGLEGNPECLSALSQAADQAIICDLNGALPEFPQPDLVLLLDVLEHLVDPAAVLAHLVGRMAPSGTVIVSLPNVAHWSVAVPLLLRGQFERTDAGIMDRTHLHFFTQQTMLELMRQAGLTPMAGLASGLSNPKTRLVDFATLGRFRTRLARQHIVAGRPATSPSGAPFVWQTC